MKKILFLDFDGVLHPSLCSPAAHFCEAEKLLSAIEGCSGLGLVISSSWRFQHSMDEMLRLIPPDIGRRVVGATPEVSPGKHQRYREILAFVEIHSKAPDWRALDDSAFEFPTACPQLILCNGKTGIDDLVVSEIRRWLEMS